jgi:hypothetical protein
VVGSASMKRKPVAAAKWKRMSMASSEAARCGSAVVEWGRDCLDMGQRVRSCPPYDLMTTIFVGPDGCAPVDPPSN